MSENIEFVRNVGDLSTDEGFQFEFYCDRCNNGIRTPFRPSVTGRVSSLLNAAGSLFGGVLSNAADLSERAHSATWEQAHDKAYRAAAEEIRPKFRQCPRCSSWVCQKSCWNHTKGLCKNCAPDLGVEMSAAQSDRAVEEIHAHSRMRNEDREMLKEKAWRETVVASCPECGAPQERNAKFCAECGAKLVAEQHCTGCGAKLKRGAKFCSECGHKVVEG